MLQTAKLFARRGNSLDTGSKNVNGLTFGEFCVLATDLKRFRTQNLIKNSVRTTSPTTPLESTSLTTAIFNSIQNKSNEATNSIDANLAPEVFLGGSCNPTTWRADVAIPALNKLGISFYNPVSIRLFT